MPTAWSKLAATLAADVVPQHVSTGSPAQRITRGRMRIVRQSVEKKIREALARQMIVAGW